MNPGRGSRRIVGLRGDGCWRCKKSWSFFERVGHIGATPATIIFSCQHCRLIQCGKCGTRRGQLEGPLGLRLQRSAGHMD